MAGDGGGSGGGGDSALTGDVDAGYYDNTDQSLSDKTSENSGEMYGGSLNTADSDKGGIVSGVLRGLEGAAVGFLTAGPTGAVKGGVTEGAKGYMEGGGILNSIVDTAFTRGQDSNTHRGDLSGTTDVAQGEADNTGGGNTPQDYPDVAGGGGSEFSILVGNKGQQAAVAENTGTIVGEEPPAAGAPVEDVEDLRGAALEELKKKKKAMKKALLGTEGILTSAPVFRKSILG